MGGLVTVRGASDDLVEIDGALREEIYIGTHSYGGEDVYLAFSNGALLHVEYSRLGVWRITPLAVGAGVDIERAPADDEDNYSDIATLAHVEWVVCGSHMVR